MKFKFLLVSVLLISLLFSKDKHPSDKYLFSETGSGYAHIKDTGTSPLRYHGISALLNAGYVQNSAKGHFEILGNISLISGSAATYYLHQHISGGMIVSYLHSLPVFENEDLRLRLGGTLRPTLAASINQSYQNAAFNMDIMCDLSLSSQFEFEFERPEKEGKFLFIKYHLPRRAYETFFRMNLPLLLFNGRPKFAYVIDDDLDLFARHYYLGGFQMGTKLSIKRYLDNGNAIELSYDWTMYTSGKKDIYLLEKAAHNLNFALYFKLN